MPKMPMKTIAPSPRAKRLHLELAEFMAASLKKEDLPSEQVLAILSHMVGQTMALLDRRKFTPGMAIEIVQANIERGNSEMIEHVVGKPQGGVQ